MHIEAVTGCTAPEGGCVGFATFLLVFYAFMAVWIALSVLFLKVDIWEARPGWVKSLESRLIKVVYGPRLARQMNLQFYEHPRRRWWFRKILGTAFLVIGIGVVAWFTVGMMIAFVISMRA